MMMIDNDDDDRWWWSIMMMMIDNDSVDNQRGIYWSGRDSETRHIFASPRHFFTNFLFQIWRLLRRIFAKKRDFKTRKIWPKFCETDFLRGPIDTPRVIWLIQWSNFKNLIKIIFTLVLIEEYNIVSVIWSVLTVSGWWLGT